MNTFPIVSIRSILALAVMAGALGCAPMSSNDDNPEQNGNSLTDSEDGNICLLTAEAHENQAGQQRRASAVMINAEFALDNEQRSRGLMHREHLAEDEGMLFYYPDSEYRGFWMFQTLIPLDIAFLDDEGRILQIQTMEPCMSSNPRDCPGYQSSDAARAALELNAGAFAEFSIAQGDYVFNAACEQAPWAEGW